MAERPTCVNCGVDVREGTSFCYNCGKPVVEFAGSESEHDPAAEAHENGNAKPEISPEAKSALEDLAERLKHDETAEDKLAQAAAERKRARVRARRTETVWAPATDVSMVRLWLITLLILAATAAVVFFAVYWK